MSSPPNRLATYRSYSYYHVLAMCDCSQTADALAETTDPRVWEHATVDTRIPDDRAFARDLGPYSPKALGQTGKYVVLINGSTDASYVINTAKWSSMTGAQAVPGDRSTSLAVEGSLSISEPKGVAFLDQVVKCCVALGVDSAQVFYVLKTFFVGHKHDNGEDYAEMISDIPPVTFICYDVTGTFTEAGGSYEMLWVGAGHGATRLPQYSKAVNAVSISAGTTLADTLTKLQNSINDNYAKYFNCVYEQISAMSGEQTAQVLQSLRRVKYVIEVGPDYTGPNASKYTVTNQPQQYKNGAGCSDAAQASFPANHSIESAISTIMMMSPQVQADMAVGDSATKVKYEYKIHTALESKPSGDAKLSLHDYTVYYRVERFASPKTISYDPDFAVMQMDDEDLKKKENSEKFQRMKRNIIEFDYMYTGKNIDILEFDMKVNMGMAYLQTATLANTFKSQRDRAPNKQMQPSVADANSHLVKFGGALVETPVFFGSQIKAANLINTQNATHAIQSAYTLTKHASLEVTDVTMRIVGNTELLGTTNRTTSPGHIIKSASRSTTQPVAPNATANFADWSLAPAYVKVNIKMPRENDDFALFNGTSSSGDPRTEAGITDYARDFWFDGYYYVIQVEHVFENGEFTQVLTMLGLPKRSAFQSTEGAKANEAEITSGVGSCFDNKIAASAPKTSSGDTDPSSTVPHAPPAADPAAGAPSPGKPTGASPTNAADAQSVSMTANSPSDVIGWDASSEEVKTALVNASAKYGVSLIVLAQMCCQESGFRPQATAAPRSSATGLFQFLQGTWNEMVSKGIVKETTKLSTQQTHSGSGANWSKPTLADPRMDAQLNAYAGAALLSSNGNRIGSTEVGDLYMAHFLGTGGARSVIKADKASGGQASLRSALGEKEFARVLKANSPYVRPDFTVREMREWAALKMAKTIKKGMAVAKKSTAQATPTTPAQQTPEQPQGAPTAGRTADQSLAAQQNAKAQQGAKETSPCGETVDKATPAAPAAGSPQPATTR